MSGFAGVTHRPGEDGLTGGSAMCGADPSVNVNGVLRLAVDGYDCLVCLSYPDPATPTGPCEGSAFSSQAAALSASLGAGFESFRIYTCPNDHTHVDGAKFGGTP